MGNNKIRPPLLSRRKQVIYRQPLTTGLQQSPVNPPGNHQSGRNRAAPLQLRNSHLLDARPLLKLFLRKPSLFSIKPQTHKITHNREYNHGSILAAKTREVNYSGSLIASVFQ